MRHSTVPTTWNEKVDQTRSFVPLERALERQPEKWIFVFKIKPFHWNENKERGAVRRAPFRSTTFIRGYKGDF
jgi:hypothetical protein